MKERGGICSAATRQLLLLLLHLGTLPPPLLLPQVRLLITRNLVCRFQSAFDHEAKAPRGNELLAPTMFTTVVLSCVDGVHLASASARSQASCLLAAVA